MDRAEASGFGIAVLGHAALLGALSLGFASAIQPPAMNAPIEVSFVDEVGLQSTVTEISPEPPAQSMAPEIGPPEEAAPTPAEAPPEPKPVEREAVNPAPPKPAPEKPRPKQETSRGGSREKSSGSLLGSDFLKGIGNEPSQSKSTKPSGAVMSSQAAASIGAAILRQVQPCANRQVKPGPGAERIRVTINLRLNRDGSLASRPRVTDRTGVDDENRRYLERVEDLAIATFTGCSPLRGLPQELYDVPNGWSNFSLRYSLPG